MKISNDVMDGLEALGKGLKALPAQVIAQATQQNPWFTAESVKTAAKAWVPLLKKEALNEWLQKYPPAGDSRNVGIIMAGNIPLVGLHDLVSVICCGHQAVCKLSSDDNVLMSYCLGILNEHLKKKIRTVEKMKEVDAIMVTGSNNTAKIFDSYFKHLPRIIRRNRTGIAVLTGNETTEDLENLGKDIFTYFGLGCRNISKLYVPEGYEFNTFFESIYAFGDVINHNKYGNNYEYNRAIYLLDGKSFLDNNFLMVKRDEDNIRSPLAVVYYDYYTNLEMLQRMITEKDEEIQCVETKINLGHPRQVGFGQAQQPRLSDYADGVDTISFLQHL